MKHTLSVHVENKPGALNRITTMFARRAFNIESLAVGPTEHHDISRITILVDCDERDLAQIEKQMHKLVNVLRITNLTRGESVERELALIKVAAPASRRPELIGLADVFELAGTPEEIDSFEELVRPHGVKELVRTGRIGLSRASSTQTGPRRQLALR